MPRPTARRYPDDSPSITEVYASFDAMYERMQLPGAADAMQKAFAMTPAELGRAAVAQADASRKPKPKGKQQRSGPR